MLKALKVVLLVIPVLLLGFAAHAEEVSKEQIKGLDEQVQEIKSDVLGIAAELNQLEEKLLYPSNTQVCGFRLPGRRGNVSPRFGGDPARRKAGRHHLYTFKELEALRREACSGSTPATSAPASTR